MIRTFITHLIIAGLMITTGFVVGHRIGAYDAISGNLPPQGRWIPCFSSPSGADMVNFYTDWVAMMEKQGTPPDPITTMTTIPEGKYKGTWILPGCVAIENSVGLVTFWEDTTSSQSRWVPHPDAPRDDMR